MSGVSQGVSQNFTKSSPDSPVHVQLNDSSFTAGSLVITSTTPINNGVTAIGSDSTGGNPDFFAAMDIIFAKDPLI